MKRRQFFQQMVATLAVITTSKMTGCAKASELSQGSSGTPAPFIFEVEPLVTGEEDTASELREKIIATWQDYLRMDTPSYLSHWVGDGIRISSRSGMRQVGVAAIESELPAEWASFERPDNLIAETMTVERAEFDIGEDYALATYWVGIEGGVRWEYSDQGLVFQAFRKDEATEEWQLAYQTDTWSLDYDVESQEPGTADTLDFAFAYPVNDLDRAIDFYTPLLGKPESVTSTRASFNIEGGRFILDANHYEDTALVKPNLPNGYALFLVEDLAADFERLEKADVELLGKPQSINGDRYCLGLDQDENVFMLWENNFYHATDFIPTVKGFPRNNNLAKAAAEVMTAWVTMDSAALASLLAPNATWFDNTRLKNRGQERDVKITEALVSEYWPNYDQGDEGLTASIMVDNFQALALGTDPGAGQLATYDLTLKGEGVHAFQNSAWVTQVFNNDLELVHTFIVDNNNSKNPVLELDYTGYPVEDLEAAQQFYEQLGLGEGYPDESYYGFWSNHAVFGLYEAEPDVDDLPQSRQTNGYMSFWVRSVEDVYRYLQEQDVNFPVIPAINSDQGIDRQPGYKQLVATDSEGNVILFTEYSGRPR